ncbi:hypothetical protein HN832_01155 [archaeon]|jgi:hypothetical protein|nr:hypothetical protein [archaeon]MBT4373819.1 hypothetical protein [archaeon]MBT4532285.1 hypothetical protein [archaeon]MBT7001110.1 hypothetical protein [archaeon]MBT7281999.1 hypothetical protein [archaeon]
MRIYIEEKERLVTLSTKALELFVQIIEEKETENATTLDQKFLEVLQEIDPICHLLSAHYREMYDYVKNPKEE